MRYLDLLEREKEFVPEIVPDSLDYYISPEQIGEIPLYFLKSMTILGKIFQREITYYLVLVYWEFLKKVPEEHLRRAFEVIIHQDKAFPAVIDFWRYIPEKECQE